MSAGSKPVIHVGQSAMRVVFTFSNINRLTPAIPEVAHAGHAVRLVRPLTPDEQDAEVGQMWRVFCTQDSATFDAFPEEIGS